MLTKSSEINELATALAKVQSELPTVGKSAENPFFKSKYAPLPEVMKVALPVLSKHGLSVTQLVDHLEGQTALITLLMHSSGQYVSGTMPLKLTKDDPQGQGSAITYAKRYAFMSALGLVADEDDDGNAASLKQGQKKTVEVKTDTASFYTKKATLSKTLKEKGLAPDQQSKLVKDTLKKERVETDEDIDAILAVSKGL